MRMRRMCGACEIDVSCVLCTGEVHVTCMNSAYKDKFVQLLFMKQAITWKQGQTPEKNCYTANRTQTRIRNYVNPHSKL